MEPLDDDDDSRQVRISLHPDTLATLTECAAVHGVTTAEAARRILVAELIDQGAADAAHRPATALRAAPGAPSSGSPDAAA